MRWRAAIAWLLRWREAIAWLLLAATCAATVFTVVQARQISGISSSERKIQVDFSDMLQTRLYQNVNAKAAVNPQFAGQGATASVNGNDSVGQVNITTGSSPSAGSLVHVTFHKPYSVDGVQPIVTLTPLDQSPPPDWYVTVDWYGFDIVVGSAPKPDTNYPFAYFVASRPWAMYLDQP